MSLFIHVTRAGGAARIFNLRRGELQVGEDANGVLTAGAPYEPFFLIRDTGEGWRLQLRISSRREVSDGVSPVQDSCDLECGATHRLGDYTFRFFITSPEAERLPVDIARLPLILARIAPGKQTLQCGN